MSNQVSALKKISSQLNESYRQFLVMANAAPMGMPHQQLDYFVSQALTRHYHVTLHIRQSTDDEPALMTGYLSEGPKDTLLVTNDNQNITQVAHLNQIVFIERDDYR
ncbi:hypothetical protein HC026_09910 [Lactobacillus sp. LC28-10]|uniref:Uncharacterized protein n=1 Tax=Secundilactobacillus angelensis TaxID=2722706 RepID=A0ABX1L191_9LACO|nr:hypothetical protein [Secundilactobacillus angelensis]MCH5463301.1 hypothetical protein [Secundilactobacillus angelensis]NLR19215.1 hypothetical protein [Secundilactobacillus angelensis]